MNSKYVFLILHYLAIRETIECIESIKRSCLQNKRIIVIDNGSANSSFEVLKEKYYDDDEVVLIRNDKNLGFAAGNNVGFRYAKEHFDPEFIIMINNDTIISQPSFLNIINEKYERYRFAVLGPDIITKDGIHQNPWIREGFGNFQIKIFRIKQKIRIVLSYLKLDQVLYQRIHKNNVRKSKVMGDVLDVPLHGAALIFSREYIDRFDGLDERTFLYLEEEILRLYCVKNHLLMMYSGDLEIYHKEDISTKMEAKKPGIKERNEFRNRIKSSYVYETIKKELKQNELDKHL